MRNNKKERKKRVKRRDKIFIIIGNTSIFKDIISCKPQFDT